MTHILGCDRRQTLLFPEAVDDYVGAENPVRFSTPLLMGSTLEYAALLEQHRCDR